MSDLFYGGEGGGGGGDAELDLEAVEEHGVEAVGVVLVVGTGVLCQRLDECRTQVGGNGGQQPLRVVYGQRLRRCRGGEAAAGVGVAVGIREVGLDVEDGCAVDEVGALDHQHGAWLDTQEPHTGETDGVGPEGAAGGEDPYPLVAAQSRRPDGGFE